MTDTRRLKNCHFSISSYQSMELMKIYLKREATASITATMEDSERVISAYDSTWSLVEDFPDNRCQGVHAQRFHQKRLDAGPSRLRAIDRGRIAGIEDDR